MLANYRSESRHRPGLAEPRPNYKARSFLATYSTGQGKAAKEPTPDLPLATATQLSAAFPLLSSWVPMSIDNQVNAPHFVDGGYYDNDGIPPSSSLLTTPSLARTPTVGKDVAKHEQEERVEGEQPSSAHPADRDS